MKRCARFVALGFVCVAANALATPMTERVVAITPDGTLQLEHAGKASFANIRLPDAALAERWLAQHVLQQSLTFETGETDRYGRTRITSDSEEKMLREGIALIYASDGDIPQNWRAAEAAARSKKTGIWASGDMALTPQQAVQHENEFHVVEGSITRIYESKSATYLNFGADWHSDFSITIPAKLRRSMRDKLAAIHEGTRIRVRGSLYEENGPMVTLSHAANLEIE